MEQRKNCLAANRCPPDQNPNTHSLKSEARRSTAPRAPVSRVSLHSHNHIIMPAQLHPQLGPLIKVLLRRHSAPNPLLLADRPVLLERACALDRRLVDACAGEDLVRALVKREVALGRPRLVGRQVGVRLDDVVLDQRVARPAVDGQVAGPGGVVGAGVFDGPGSGLTQRRVMGDGVRCGLWEGGEG
jgi:hypothetical protein